MTKFFDRLLLVLFVFFSVSAPAWAQESQEPDLDVDARLAALEQGIQRLEVETPKLVDNKLEERLRRAEAPMRDLDRRVVELGNRTTKLRKGVVELGNRTTDLDQRVTALGGKTTRVQEAVVALGERATNIEVQNKTLKGDISSASSRSGWALFIALLALFVGAIALFRTRSAKGSEPASEPAGGLGLDTSTPAPSALKPSGAGGMDPFPSIDTTKAA